MRGWELGMGMEWGVGVGAGAGGDGRLGVGAVGLRLAAVGFGDGGTEILGLCLIQWLIHTVKISSKSEVFQFPGAEAPIKGPYNNQKNLKSWESALLIG